MGAFDRLLNLVVPSTCAGCGLPGKLLCADCRAALRPGPGVPCERCGHPWPVAVSTCPECPPRLDTVRALGRYDATARAVISAFKDQGRPALAPLLAGLLAASVPPPPGDAVLVPVPLTARRQRQRGFNQAQLVARHLARRWQCRMRPLLERVREGATQRGASRTDRIRQVRGVFRADETAREVRAAILVDDVLTTGSTLSAAARVLRRAGIASVGAVVVVRVERGASSEYATELSRSWVTEVRDS